MGLFDNLMGKNGGRPDLNRYVKDYEIVEEKDAKGRTRRRARYIGVWTALREPAAARPRLVIALALSLALAAVYVRMLLLTHFASGNLLVMLPLLAGLFPTLYLVMGCLSLPFGGKPQRRDQYMHSFIRASRSAAAAGLLALAGLLASLILRIARGDWLFLGEDVQFVVFCLLILGLAGAVIGLLRSIELAERPNSAFGSKLL